SPKVGPLNFGNEDGAGPLGLAHKPFSETTGALIDSALKRIVGARLAEAQRLLAGNRPRLGAPARARLAAESLQAAGVLRVTGLPPKPAVGQPTVAASRSQA